ncbi:MAG: hypothetical protein KGL25_03805 [Gammaproteobacteria bacterium]|nr:hypothetical protein [Gammaproteobacteria bacterium]MDE2250512.1 hypothetical protein [Gammaproteobacteria bacterium]
MNRSLRGRIAACLMLLTATAARSQAWLPDAGTMLLSFVHGDVQNDIHYLPNGAEIDAGHARTFSEVLGLAYAPTNHWLLSASVPYVRAMYHGPFPDPDSPVDDGRYHGTFTDLRLEAHYQLEEQPFAFSPYLALVVPSHSYVSLGHSAPGRDLHEEWFGFYIGKSLDPWLPRTYLQLRYAYAFVEKLMGVAHDRSLADFEIGYFPDPKWSVRALASWMIPHGGIDVPPPPDSPYMVVHDRLAAERYLQAGGGVAWSPSDSTSMYLLYRQSLSGANGHKVNNGFTFGYGYSFHVGH